MSVAHRVRVRRRRVVVASGVALFLALYLTVVALYALSDREATATGCAPSDDPDVVSLALTVDDVRAASDRLAVKVDITGFGPLADEDGLAAEPLTLVLTGSDGPRTHTIGAGELPSPVAADLLTTGFIERWPFDTHVATTSIAVLRQVGQDYVDVPLDVCARAHVPGWTFAATVARTDTDVELGGAQIPTFSLVATRSVATVVFGMVLLALMIVLPVLALTVAIQVYRGRRKAEATLTSWIAAMLFATIPLRTFLPGSPPIGSWVDYVIVLWVVAGLVTGLVIYVCGWLRWAPPGEAPAARAEPPAASGG